MEIGEGTKTAPSQKQNHERNVLEGYVKKKNPKAVCDPPESPSPLRPRVGGEGEVPTYRCAIPLDHRRLIGATPAALVEVGKLDLLAAALGREVRRGGGQPPRLQHRDVHRVQPRHRLEGERAPEGKGTCSAAA